MSKKSKKKQKNKIVFTTEEDSIQVQKHLQTLRELLTTDKELCAPSDDASLLMFLRSMEFDCQGTFKLIQKYYQLRIDHPEVFLKVSPSELYVAFEGNMLNLLPKRDQHGRRILIFKPGAWDPSQFTMIESLRAIHFCLEVALQDEDTQKNGIVVLIDWKGISWKQAQHIRPSISMITVRLLLECAPARYQAYHMINQNTLFEFIYVVIRQFLAEDIRKKIHRHGNNWPSLHKHIDPSVLPVEYGGSWMSEDSGHAEFIRELFACDNYFIKQSKYGYTTKCEE